MVSYFSPVNVKGLLYKQGIDPTPKLLLLLSALWLLPGGTLWLIIFVLLRKIWNSKR